MRITIDLSPAVHHHAGLGRYSQELLAAMLQVAPANEYTVFYNSPRRDLSPEAPLDQLPRRTLPLSNKPWRMSVLLAHFLGYKMDRWLKPGDVFHATEHLLPTLDRPADEATDWEVLLGKGDCVGSSGRSFTLQWTRSAFVVAIHLWPFVSTRPRRSSVTSSSR